MVSLYLGITEPRQPVLQACLFLANDDCSPEAVNKSSMTLTAEFKCDYWRFELNNAFMCVKASKSKGKSPIKRPKRLKSLSVFFSLHILLARLNARLFVSKRSTDTAFR